jgi:hypothetical protein
MRDQIHVGDTPLMQYTIKDGDDDVADAYDDLNDATVLELTFNAPTGGTGGTVTASVPTGEDSVLEYQCEIGTFDAAGTWQVQARVQWGTAIQFYTDLDEFEVHSTL